MLINEKRALAYTTRVLWIKPIEGADNIELIGILGWVCIAKKHEFNVGDLCVYFEIDSKLPEADWSEFMRNKHFKVKTMKLNRFKVLSQGLALPLSAFGDINIPLTENQDVTELLKVTYADAEDNKRKANSEDKYKKMAQRHGKLFKKQPFRWLMKRNWGKKLLFVFFGKKKDKKNGWPNWVTKTDEERCQNMPWLFPGDPDTEWIATEKIDGTSTTFTLKRGKGFRAKNEFYVCSRNVVFDTPKKECYYETNVYLEMAEKYKIREKLEALLNDSTFDFITLQGETYGEGVQKRDYSVKSHNFMAFNYIVGKNGEVTRYNPIDMKNLLEPLGIPCVPVIDEHFKIPATCNELLTIAEGDSVVDGGMREGLVFRSVDGQHSFKAVSNPFLLKYHS